jgi:hypothetical protein
MATTHRHRDRQLRRGRSADSEPAWPTDEDSRSDDPTGRVPRLDAFLADRASPVSGPVDPPGRGNPPTNRRAPPSARPCGCVPGQPPCLWHYGVLTARQREAWRHALGIQSGAIRA